MADIRPFHGVHYNIPLIGEAGRVICPPYDVISPAFQDELYRRSDFNFVRVEYGKDLPGDTEQDNRYTRAADTLNQWLTRGILLRDRRPAIYIDDHHFNCRGKTYCRRNLNCIIRLEPWDTGVVRPHEAIFARAKSDRLNLLYALQANTSPIMGLYEDRNGSIPSALSALAQVPPLFTADMGDGEYHEIRPVTDAKTLTVILGVLADKPVYIADGHHRYESALTYQRERRMRANTPPGEEPFDYVMITLADFADPGLVILPAHRMISGIDAETIRRLPERLAEFFDIRTIPVGEDPVSQADAILGENEGRPAMVLFGLRDNSLDLLTVRDAVNVESTMPYFHSPEYRKLDVSVLDHVILERLMGLNADSFGAHLGYTNETADAVRATREGECQLSVLMNPVESKAIKAVADKGDRMPRKSTYFYPKIPAGIVVYRYE